jgi:hypothetical protein
MKKILPVLLVLLLAAMGVRLCFHRFAAVPIGELSSNPKAYEGKTVAVSGEVTDRVSFLMYYKVKDGSGELEVIGRRILPQVGEKVRVKGQIRGAFSIGDAQTIVLVEEGER